MLEIVATPGFGQVNLKHLVSDFTGTLSVHGSLVPGVRVLLNKISEILDVHVLTADTFGMARSELSGVACRVHILAGSNEDLQKEEYVRTLGAENVIALGNGNNDRKMLKAASGTGAGVAIGLMSIT